MNTGRVYEKGRIYLVRLERHHEPVQLVSVEIAGVCAGGGLMLIADRGDGEVDRVIRLLNEAEKANHTQGSSCCI